MDFDAKWYFIAIAVIFGAGMAAAAYTEHTESQCKIAALQAKVPAAQIDEVCK